MGRTPIDGSSCTPVTVPEMGRDKGGIRALGFVSVGSVWSLGIFESSQFDLPLYVFMNMSRTLELFWCLEFVPVLDLCFGTVAIVAFLHAYMSCLMLICKYEFMLHDASVYLNFMSMFYLVSATTSIITVGFAKCF